MHQTPDSRDTRSDDLLATIQPSYAPLVPACARFGIGRTIAFKLAREGTIETFRIGARTFVTLASLEQLPRLMKARR
ncbi:hypothetical protein [Lysobacter sp. CFH 32150]|uniref:hypothetical protein n=1 Tax=Lysobacter sp. CFH 32150 TaxID=2927128 RepID=UPI001FA736CE|nr:hypothetical protein [Lysobacter sp. CFH 32150]MCI4566386.1 hypothetical protein [Lysobacter sp. CFH 32150]